MFDTVPEEPLFEHEIWSARGLAAGIERDDAVSERRLFAGVERRHHCERPLASRGAVGDVQSRPEHRDPRYLDLATERYTRGGRARRGGVRWRVSNRCRVRSISAMSVRSLGSAVRYSAARILFGSPSRA